MCQESFVFQNDRSAFAGTVILASRRSQVAIFEIKMLETRPARGSSERDAGT
jgi:hypothetical protein